MDFTARSYIEEYQDCPRSRFNLQFLFGRGVVSTRASVPLVTGGAVHAGVAHLLNRVRIGQTPDVNTAVQLARDQYVSDVGESGFNGDLLKTVAQERFTYEEQKALTEQLVRAWYKKELPRIQERYTVIAVEREIEPVHLVDDVYLQARVDAELMDKDTREFVNYSLKTCKLWDERMESSYKSDLQGITEIWATEQDSERSHQHLQEIQRLCGNLGNAAPFGGANYQKVREWAGKQAEATRKKISNIRFCYLVKGKQYKNEGYADALKVTYNPLLRGYRNVGPSGINYAHSWSFPNPENKSGRGTLGKGWEAFNVWESDIGLQRWAEWIATGALQPECGDVIKQHVVTPPEYFRREEEITTGIHECQFQEARVFQAAKLVNDESLPVKDREAVLEEVFPHNRKHCFYRFGERCQYYDLCWSPEVSADPIGSGLYQIRTPHHQREQEYLAEA